MATLYELTDNYKKIIEMAEDNDSVAIRDTLDSINEAFEDKAENTAKVIRDLETQSEAKKTEAKKLKERATTLDNQAKQLKKYLIDQLELTGKSKIQGKVLTVSIRNNQQSVYVEDERQIPRGYFNEQEPKLDKNRLKDDLKKGTEINGVELRRTKGVNIK